MDNIGIFGPFKNGDDINKFWYQFTEEELKKDIQRAKKDLEEAKNLKEDTITYEQGVMGLTDELNNLQSFVDDYTRCLERHKYGKNALQQIQNDWSDYNLSLYADWCRLQAAMLNSALMEGEELENRRKEARSEKIKREEIEKRIRELLKE